MKKTLLLTGLFFAAIFTACDNQESEKLDPEVEPGDVVNCVYTFDEDKMELQWTAYKFTRKAPVFGTFTHMQVEGKLEGAVPKEMLESFEFQIPTSTVETNDPSRNKKIDSLFFSKLDKTSMITGNVVALKDDGTAVINIKMNDIEKEVIGKYTLEDNKFAFETQIDLSTWDALEQLNELNVACKDLHTDVENGEKVSKLWPDITISFKTELVKVCD
ncbi:MAG: YceI family protein [Brumimicrobium sp.]|nr:YceI family protein [Brumimicrobium sp.]